MAAFELITSNQLTSDTTTVNFTVPTGFFGLEMRIFGRTTGTAYYVADVLMTVNGTSPNPFYRAMRLYPAGSMSGYSGNTGGGLIFSVGAPSATTTSSYFRIWGANTSENKTLEAFCHPEARVAGGDSFLLGTGEAFTSSAPITSLSLTPGSSYGNFAAGVRFDLYGIR